jgi:microcystin-dependent protein
LASLGSVSGASGIFGAVSGTTITASTQFTGPGTGLTGTAGSLSIGGNAATATNATNAATVTTTVASGATGTTQAVSTNNTTIATTAFVRSIIPAGVILMWSGSIASIPSGWVLCDGGSGTPNLRDRFIVGAGSAYAVNATGGNADAVVVSHSHTFAGDALGTHSHTLTTNRTSKSGNATPFMLTDPNVGENLNGSAAFNTSGVSAGTPSGTISTAGVSGTNANLPPYYALAYIMKT